MLEGRAHSRLFLSLGCAFALLFLLVSPAAHAVDQPLADPALEARALALHKQLRCLVCQNQSIADSEAPLAQDLRHIVRERLAAGDSDAAVLDFLVVRYGDWVLLQPPLKSATWLLWGAPILILLLAGLLGGWWLRNQRRPAPAAALSTEEEKRLKALLSDDGRG